jgi:hypothetical protein
MREFESIDVYIRSVSVSVKPLNVSDKTRVRICLDCFLRDTKNSFEHERRNVTLKTDLTPTTNIEEISRLIKEIKSLVREYMLDIYQQDYKPIEAFLRFAGQMEKYKVFNLDISKQIIY